MPENECWWDVGEEGGTEGRGLVASFPEVAWEVLRGMMTKKVGYHRDGGVVEKRRGKTTQEDQFMHRKLAVK